MERFPLVFVLMCVLTVIRGQHFERIIPADQIEVYAKGFLLKVQNMCDGCSPYYIQATIRITIIDSWLNTTTINGGDLTRNVSSDDQGRSWFYNNTDQILQEEDIILYTIDWVQTISGHGILGQNYQISELRSHRKLMVDKQITCSDRVKQKSSDCYVGNTFFNGIRKCGGDVIFEDDFSSFDDKKWRHEVRYFDSSESQFTLYSNTLANSSGTLGVYSVKSYGNNEKGVFFIQPKILEDFSNISVLAGSLELQGCTSPKTKDCVRESQFWKIIPPIVSARITTKHSFSFKYGEVEVRAKLPQGDWIVPEIWLEPQENVYGEQSGRIFMGKVRGNRDLRTSEGDNIGAILLEQGFTLNSNKSVVFSKQFGLKKEDWTSDFHVFKVTWTQSRLTFSVDGVEMGFKEPDWRSPLNRLIKGSIMAPFDHDFFLHLGVHVGGRVDFPDGSFSDSNPKPWANDEVKNVYKFWNDKSQWIKTWSNSCRWYAKDPDWVGNALIVDYVKVKALSRT